MTRVTREEAKSIERKLGGDLHNKYKLCTIAFNKFPEAEEIEYTVRTGLWVDITYKNQEGKTFTGRIQEGFDQKYFK